MATFTPTQLQLTTAGQLPAFGTRLYPSQLVVTVEGLQPAQYIGLVGSRFSTVTNIKFVVTPTASVAGGAFASTPTISGGGVVKGGSVSSTATITVLAAHTMYVSAQAFNSSPVIRLQDIVVTHANGRGFSSDLQVFGSGLIRGQSVSTSATITVRSNEVAHLMGASFATYFVSQSKDISGIQVTGRAFQSSLYYARVAGYGFESSAIVAFAFDASYAQAFVANVRTGAVTRYEGFPFQHIARIDGQYYGIKADGIYLLQGSESGWVQTGAMDFGTFQSKSTPYLYMNGDDTYTVKAYVDQSQQPSFESKFSGRRVKLARGNKGRYWSFEISGINKLQGIEFMPEQISRRVK